MHTEGSCFGLDSVATCVRVSRFTVVLSLAGADALPRTSRPSGKEGIFSLLKARTHPHQSLLPTALTACDKYSILDFEV